MSQVKISVNLQMRSFEIEAPEEQVEAILDKIDNFFRINDFTSAISTPLKPEEQTQQETIDDVKDDTTNRKRAKVNTKTKSYELVELNLSEAQRSDIRADFAEKSPEQQNNQVAVLGVKLKQYLNKSEFTANEIHTAFKIVNKPTPRNLLSVFSNMKRDGRANYNNSCVVINSATEDYVNFHMKEKEPKKK